EPGELVAARVPERIRHLDRIRIRTQAGERLPDLVRRSENDREDELLALEAGNGFQRALVSALREHDPLPDGGRTGAQGLEERAHVPLRSRYFATSRSRTSGETNSPTSPPSRAISRTSEAERKEYRTSGARKSVSIPGMSCRFMRAIWNSY